jgi:hypothetical protein
METRPICTRCNKNVCTKNGFTVKGDIKYHKYCNSCERIVYDMPLHSYTRYKKSICEKCGFVPEHNCQLDVDHIDGNHSNDDESNLQTLCANCHRLKTFYERDAKKKKSTS